MQTPSLMVLMKLVVFTRPSFDPQSFSATVAPWAPKLCQVRAFPLQDILWGLWATGVTWANGRLQCGTDQGNTVAAGRVSK